MLSDSVGAVRRKQRLRFSSCLFDTGRGFQDLKTSPARLIPSKAGQGDNQRKPERERERERVRGNMGRDAEGGDNDAEKQRSYKNKRRTATHRETKTDG